MRRGHERDQAGEHQRAALEPDARGCSDEIAERSAERVRYQNRHPVENLVLPRGDVLVLDLSRGATPYEKDRNHATEQDERRLHVAEPEGAIDVVRHRRADSSGGDHDEPIKERVVALRRNLSGERDAEEPEKDQAADGIAKPQCHRKLIAAGLAKCRRADLDHPEHEGDVRDLTDEVDIFFDKILFVHG